MKFSFINHLSAPPLFAIYKAATANDGH